MYLQFIRSVIHVSITLTQTLKARSHRRTVTCRVTVSTRP